MRLRGRLLLVLVSLALGVPGTALASELFGGIGWETSREFGGFSEQPPGGLVTISPLSPRTRHTHCGPLTGVPVGFFTVSKKDSSSSAIFPR
jgi:hypothetical protein